MSGDIVKVFNAASSGCNTARDVSEVTGLGLPRSSAYISKLIAYGALRKTGRYIPRDAGHRAMVFEVSDGFRST